MQDLSTKKSLFTEEEWKAVQESANKCVLGEMLKINSPKEQDAGQDIP